MGKTKKIIDYAYDQANPEFGEGWGCFANILELKMEEMEELIKEALEHIEDYDDGMAGWLDKAREFLA